MSSRAVLMKRTFQLPVSTAQSSRLAPRWWFWLLFLTTVLVAGAVRAADIVPEDTCIIQVLAPQGTTVALNGKDYGIRNTFTYRPLERGKMYSVRVVAKTPEGKRMERQLFLKGGWLVRLSMSSDDAPRLVLQTGHSAIVTSVAFSPDGRYVLTGSRDNTAILWDADSGRQLRTFAGHQNEVTSVAFSPDARQILTGSYDKTAILWDVRTGGRIRKFSGHTRYVSSVAFSPDGRRVLTGSRDKTAILWDLTTGRRLRTFTGHTSYILSVAFSPDGRHLLTGSSDTTAILWNATTGAKLRTFAAHRSPVKALAFSPDGRRVLTGSYDEFAILWDAKTGARVRILDGHRRGIVGLSFSPDGRQILTGDGHRYVPDARNRAILWDAVTGKKLRTIGGQTGGVTAVAFASDGRQLLTGSARGATLWNTETGTKVQNYSGQKTGVVSVAFGPKGRRVASVAFDSIAIFGDTKIVENGRSLTGNKSVWLAVAFSPDGRHLAAGASDGAWFLWDLASKRKMRTFARHRSMVESVAFSPDGRSVLAGATLWSVATGKKIRTFAVKNGWVSSAAFSPDGRRVLTGSRGGTARLWDVKTGTKLRTFNGASVAFSPNGHRLLTGSYKEANLWDAATGAKLKTFSAHKDMVSSVAFSSDDQLVVTSSWDKRAILWDTATGKKLRVFAGHSLHVNSVALSADGRTVLTGSSDGTTRLWDIATGDELCRLISLANGKEWLVVTPEGLFDGSPGARQNVMYRVGEESDVVPVDRFFQDFYYPGLLAAILGGQRPMPKTDFGQIAKNKPPTLKIVSPKRGGELDASSIQITVDVTDQGGGIKGPVVRLNGQKLKLNPEIKELGKVRRVTFTVPLTEAQNRIRIEAASRNGAWESEPEKIRFTNIRKLPRPNLYVVAIGVNKYKSESMRLDFARTDAEAVADLFEKRAKQLYAKTRIHRLLDEQATAKNIKTVLTDEKTGLAAKVRPQDMLVVFVSGHGFTVGQRYYFLPHDFQRASSRFEDDVRKHGIPSDVLGDWISSVKATKRIVIMDTCNSGAAIKQLGRTRSGAALDGAIERLGRASGIFVIAAAPATADAREVPSLKHGILTYSLLAGMKATNGGPLAKRAITLADPKSAVDVGQWFHFASQTVPALYRQYLGHAQDVVMHVDGNSFPVLPLRIK